MIDEITIKNRALEATSEGIAIADARLEDNPLIYVNGAYERLTGYKSEEILGRNARFLQSPESNPETIQSIREALKKGGGCDVEILNRRKDGIQFWNHFSLTPIRNESGDITHYIGVHRDITETRRLQEELLRSKKALEDAYGKVRIDLDAAAALQRHMLPQIPCRSKDFHVSWLLEPSSHLSGDILNIIPLGGDTFGLYVMDVSGHGVPASLLSMTMHHEMSSNPAHSCLFTRNDGNLKDALPARPSDVLEQLNARFPFDPDRKQFVTMIYGIYDSKGRTFRYASAGHLQPILLAGDGKSELFPSEGFPIGFVHDPQYEEHEIRMNPGDRLFLISDGMVEPFNADGEDFGMDRLITILSKNRHHPLEKTLKSAMAAVRTWARGSVLEDDATVLGLEVL